MQLSELEALLHELNVYSVALRILLAVIIGGLIGSERGRHGRAAGLRTHILVCLGAAMTTMIGLYVSQKLGSTGDPLRMGSQVVSGIGFLGAGTIIVRNRNHVTGLTTAAGLWATACIGLAIGVGFYWAVLVAAAAVIITFTILIYLERTAKQRDKSAFYVEVADIHQANELYLRLEEIVAEVDIVPARSGIPDHVGLEVIARKVNSGQEFLNTLRTYEQVIIAVPMHV